MMKLIYHWGAETFVGGNQPKRFGVLRHRVGGGVYPKLGGKEKGVGSLRIWDFAERPGEGVEGRGRQEQSPLCQFLV